MLSLSFPVLLRSYSVWRQQKNKFKSNTTTSNWTVPTVCKMFNPTDFLAPARWRFEWNMVYLEGKHSLYLILRLDSCFLKIFYNRFSINTYCLFHTDDYYPDRFKRLSYDLIKMRLLYKWVSHKLWRGSAYIYYRKDCGISNVQSYQFLSLKQQVLGVRDAEIISSKISNIENINAAKGLLDKNVHEQVNVTTSIVTVVTAPQ